ncbi:MAG: hypothetical protein AAGF89_12210, partial [Bacteroidota bacterium]
QKGQLSSLEIDLRNTLGNVHWKVKNYPLAEQQFLLGLDLAEVQKNNRLRTEFHSYLAGVQYNLGKLREARKNGLAGAALAEEQGLLKLAYRTHGHLALIEKQAGNFEAAYDNMVMRSGFQDSLHRTELAENLAEFTARFEKEKQDFLIKEQQTQLTLLENQTKIDRLQKSILWVGLLGLILVFGAVAYSLRQRVARQRLEKETLAGKVKGQQRELSAHALQMAQKSRLLDQLSEELRNIKGERPDDRKKLDSVLRELSSEERIDNDWHNFRTYFQGVHGDFEDRLKVAADQTLSPRELRMAALIKMQLNNQEIGTILGVSQDSLYKAKYRLRKKFSQAEEGALDAFITEI